MCIFFQDVEKSRVFNLSVYNSNNSSQPLLSGNREGFINILFSNCIIVAYIDVNLVQLVQKHFPELALHRNNFIQQTR